MSTIQIFVNMTDEWRKAIEWNLNDSKPMTDEEIGEHLSQEILKDRFELIHGRHGYRESMGLDRRGGYSEGEVTTKRRDEIGEYLHPKKGAK